jgi:hypothetical protein
MNFSRHSSYIVPESVIFDDTAVHVTLHNGDKVSAPLTRFPRLANGTAEQRNQWRVTGSGDGIHWPLLDEDVSIRGLFSEERDRGSVISNIDEIISRIGAIYQNSLELCRISGGRKFILDGIFVATTGQVIAEYIYGLKPAATGEPFLHADDCRTVKVALTGRTRTGFAVRWTEASKKSHADLLLCLQHDEQGIREIYNGEFPTRLFHCRKVPANGQIHLSIGALSELNPALLDKKHSLASINQLLNTKLARAA